MPGVSSDVLGCARAFNRQDYFVFSVECSYKGLRNVRQGSPPLRGLGFCLDRQLWYGGCQPLLKNTRRTDVEEGFPSFTKKAIKFYCYRNPGLSIVELVCCLEIIMDFENAGWRLLRLVGSIQCHPTEFLIWL